MQTCIYRKKYVDDSVQFRGTSKKNKKNKTRRDAYSGLDLSI